MKITIVSLAFIFFVSCSCNPNEGFIIKKWHEPRSISVIVVPLLIGKVKIQQAYTVIDDEDFCIKIEGERNKKKRTLYLPKEAWGNFDVGDYYVIQNKKYTHDKVVKKKK